MQYYTKKIDSDTIKSMLESHQKWLITKGEEGEEADFSDMVLSYTNFSAADLSNVSFSRSYLYNVNLSGTNLAGANMYRTCLIESNLENANLTGAFLAQSNLSGSNLTRACFIRAKLYGADLRDVIINDTNFTEASMHEIRLDTKHISGLCLQEHYAILIDGKNKHRKYH